MKNHSMIAPNSGGGLDTPQWTIHCASWCVLLWQIWSASVLRRLKHATFSCQNKSSSYRVERRVAARRSESKNKQRVSVLLAGLNGVGCRKAIWGEGRQLESNLAGASDSSRSRRECFRDVVYIGLWQMGMFQITEGEYNQYSGLLIISPVFDSYEFTVKPKNDLGIGPESEPVSFNTESGMITLNCFRVQPQTGQIPQNAAITCCYLHHFGLTGC